MGRMARFQGGALAIRPKAGSLVALRPPTAPKPPGIGGRIRAGLGGLKRRAKNLLARPGIQKAMNRVGMATGNAVGWARRKTGFSSYSSTATFARRRLGRKRRSLLRRLAMPAMGVGAVGVLGGAGYLASRQRRATNNKIGAAQSVLRDVQRQQMQDVANVAELRGSLRERARIRRGD